MELPSSEEPRFPEDLYRPSSRSTAGESPWGLENQGILEMKGPGKRCCEKQETDT